VTKTPKMHAINCAIGLIVVVTFVSVQTVLADMSAGSA